MPSVKTTWMESEAPSGNSSVKEVAITKVMDVWHYLLHGETSQKHLWITKGILLPKVVILSVKTTWMGSEASSQQAGIAQLEYSC